MSQHDFNIANQTRTNFRADLNSALQALLSKSSGTSEPSVKTPFMSWVDEEDLLLKMYNDGAIAGSPGMMILAQLDLTNGGWEPVANNFRAASAAGFTFKNSSNVDMATLSDLGDLAAVRDLKYNRDLMSGAVKVAAIGSRTILLPGTGTYTRKTNCRMIRVQGQAGGGGGGGVNGVGSDDSMGSGGASGAYFDLFINADEIEDTYSYEVGEGGLGGGAGDNDGSAGGDTIFNGATKTATATGGNGGTGHTASGGSSFASGGAPGVASLSGYLSSLGIDGQRGLERRIVAGVFNHMSRGGDSFFAAGGHSFNTGGGGQVGKLGSGGSGAHSNNATNRAGGAGGGGQTLITEYY